ncbi:ecdysteroid kinase domain-containing protein [Ditylenchus destructor]|nr:ecdysteroid kinase domain-containing protein [Ditylenchus destructor]
MLLLYVKTIVDHLAAFHHYLLCTVDEEWKNIFDKNFFFEHDTVDFDEVGKGMIDKMIAWNKDFESPLNKLRKVMSTEICKYIYKDCAAELDLWSNNLLWNKRSDGESPDKVAAFIDWQLSTTGNLTIDIARILMLCCEPEIRRELESCILEYYYNEFSRKMNESGKPVKYRVDQLKKAYEYASISQGLNLCFVAQVLDQMDDSPKMKENIEKVVKRAKIALYDTVERTKNLAPDWISK